MTKKQYEETIKAVMEYTTEVINKAKTEQEKNQSSCNSEHADSEYHG